MGEKFAQLRQNFADSLQYFGIPIRPGMAGRYDGNEN